MRSCAVSCLVRKWLILSAHSYGTAATEQARATRTHKEQTSSVQPTKWTVQTCQRCQSSRQEAISHVEHDAEEEEHVCWYGPTLRAAAKTEGLRIRRSRHTTVRKRTASAMTPCSASANACIIIPGFHSVSQVLNSS